MNTSRKIILLNGKAGSGKDFIADWLVKNKGYTKLAFSSILKKMASERYNLDIDTFLLMNGRNFSNFDTKVIKNIYIKYNKLKNNEILNHTSFKLSDLDLEMIKNIPQGGNWKNIPEETIKKSKRLMSS